MTCALTEEQLENLYRVVYTEIAVARNNKQPFDVYAFTTGLYKKILDKSGDQDRAVAFAQQVPEFILSAMTMNNLWKHLLDTGFDANSVMKLASDFKNETTGYQSVVDYVSVKMDAKEAEQAIIADQDTKPQVQATVDEVPEEESSKPLNPWSTTGQEAKFWNQNTQPDEFAARNEIDAEKSFHNNVIRAVGQAVRDEDGDSSKARIGSHVGFKLQLVPASAFPMEYLYKETQIWLNGPSGNLEKHNQGVLAVLADNSGNWLYFNQQGEVADRSSGKPVYSFIRVPREKAGKLTFLKRNSEEQLLTPQEILVKEQKNAVKNQSPYTEEFSKQRLAELIREREEKIDFIQKVREYLNGDKNRTVNLEITGGTLGVITSKWERIGKFVTDEDLRSITLDKSLTGTGGGRYMIRLKNIATPIPIDRPQMTTELAGKIASVLSLPIKVDGELMSNSAKVDFVKQFIQNGNKYSNNFVITYNTDDGSIFLSILGTKMNVPTPEELDKMDRTSLQKAYKFINDKLLSVEGKKTSRNPMGLYPSRLSINDDLVSRGIYVDYTIDGEKAVAETKSYYDFLREGAQIGVAGTNDMEVTQLNAYLHFAPTTEVLDQVYGRSKAEPVKAPEQKTPDPHEDDINTGLIDGLFKARGIDNTATPAEIANAKTWYESHPMSKHVPYKAMFNIVNSDAFAQWTKNGITLYEGANYTDLYHEAWHGFTQLFLTKDQKKKLYDEARKVPALAGASDFVVEEYLAEDFRKYAMAGGRKGVKSPVRAGIFRRIYNFLKELFFGIKPKELITQPDSIAHIRDIYDKLFYSQINSYLPSINNIQFGVLNKGVEPVVESKDQAGPVERPLSLEESRVLVDSVDSLISEAINQVNKFRANATATTQILTEKDKLSKLYNNIKQNFEKRRDKFLLEATEEKDEFLKQQKLENAKLLEYAIRNFGDPSRVLSGAEDKGLVAYHQKKTKFLGVSQHVYDITDEATSDEDVINKGMRRNDRSGNELSLKELANDETLYLVRSLHRIEGGAPVNNRLGIPELVDFDRTWNKIVRTLEGSMTPEEMYTKLQAAQAIFPEFSQLIQKLADPERTDLTSPEFDMNTKFWQDFNKPRVPLVQMILDKTVSEDADGNETTNYDMRIGQASADYFKVIQSWKNRFRTDSPNLNRFIRQDSQRHNYLNTSAVLKEFADPRGALKDGREYDFLRAIGFYFDADNPVMKDNLRTMKSIYGVGYIFNAIKAVHNALQHPAGVKLTKDQQSAQTAAHAFMLDPIEGLRKAQPDLGFDSNAGRVKGLAEFHAKFSDDYSDFGVVNAENNRQYEHTLNNTLTVTLNSINKANTYQELVDPLVDTENNFRHMRWLNIDRNPLAKSSVWLNSIFDLDRFKADGTPNPEFGKKRISSTEEGSGVVKVNIENLSGVQIVINGLYPETGIATSRSDRTTKFLSDFHMMLLTGRMELMRHASKSSAYDVVISNIRTDPSKKDNKLYVDTSKFISPKGSDAYDGFGYAFKIIQSYVEAELNRIKMVNANLPYYKNVAGYNRAVGNNLIAGQVFTVFDDVFSDSLKNKLYNLKGPFTEEILKAENEALRNQVKSELKGYFDRLTAQNEGILNEGGTKYIHQKVYDKVRAGTKGLSNDQVEKAAMRSYTYNSWIHNFESIAVIYGDLAQYNHSKEEFHKRNAGTGSTGYMYRADKAAQAHVTNVVGRKYAESIGAPVQGYNGTLTTAVLKDSIVTSVYEKEYRDAFTKYYYSILENRSDLSQAEKKRLTDEKVDSAMAAYTNMTEGDGQGGVAFDSYRIMKKLEGKWTDAQERLYNNIISGKHRGDVDVTQFFPAYKIQYYGPLDTQGLPVMAFHKFSLYPMIPSVIKGTNMETVHNMMVRQGVDYILFESGSKVGSVTSNGKPDAIYTDNKLRTINERLQFTKNTIFANYLKDQLDIHNEFKGKVIFSTQLRKLIEEGLFEYGLPIDFLVGAPTERRIKDWSQLNEEYRLKASTLYGLAKRYENNIQELSQLKKQELLEEAGWVEDAEGNPQGDLKNLLEVVRKNLGMQDIADHQLDFLDVDDAGNLKWDLSLHLNAEKLEKLLTAMVNNRLIRQKVKGESLVQVASSLLEKKPGTFTNPTQEDLRKYQGSNDLPTYHKVDPSDQNSKTAAMKVKIALQGDWMNLLKLNHIDGQPIETRERLNESIRNEEWLNTAQNRKAVSMVGVRIPVQGLNSMEFMEIYEFLPAEAGNIIIPPSEIVAKSGADFDIDKLTVFMTAIGSNGEFLTRGQYREGTDSIDLEIQKLREKQAPLKEKALKTLQIAKESRDLSRDFMKKELPKIQEALAVLKEERAHLLDLIRNVINQLVGAERLPAQLAEAANSSDSDLLKALHGLSTRGGLKRIDQRIEQYYSEVRKLKAERMQELYEEKELQMQSLKDYQDEVKVARDKADEALEPFRKKLNHLRELKKRYASTVENEIIEDIRAILEHPSNYISLIRPNGTDIVRPVADDATTGLAQYVQDYNPRDNYTAPVPKKGVSPTRVLETPYNLYKHESNNIGKRTLGIGAVENTYSTIFNRIGAYMNDSYVYSSRAGQQERRIDLLLPHNTLISEKSTAAIPDAGFEKNQLLSDLVKAGKIILDEQGKPVEVKQNSGYPSQLFKDLVDILGSTEDALDAYLNIKSTPFKNKYGQWENTIMRDYGRAGFEYQIRKSIPSDKKLTEHRPDEFVWSEGGKKQTIFFNDTKLNRARPFAETKKDYLENIIDKEIESYKEAGNTEALKAAERYRMRFNQEINTLRDLKLHLIHQELYGTLHAGERITPADIEANQVNSLNEIERLNKIELAKDYFGEPMLFMHAGPEGITKFLGPGDKGYVKRDKLTGTSGVYFNRDIKMIDKYAGVKEGKPTAGKDIYYAFLKMKKPFYILDPEAQKIRNLKNSITLTEEDMKAISAAGYDGVIWDRGYDVNGFEQTEEAKPARPKLEAVVLKPSQAEIAASFREGMYKGQTGEKISLASIYDVNGENKISDIISQLMNGWVDIEKDAWIFFVQGNNEITPTLLFLVKSGVPFKQAAWFVSQPMVREYVREQRLARSTFSGPLGKSPSNPMFYRAKAKSDILMKYFGRTFKPAELYTETVATTKNVLGDKGQFSQDMIERIVKTKDTRSPEAKAAFLHFLEIEEMMKGIANLKFKTNFDTRRSTTLFDAVNRIAEIETLRNESRLPTELIDKVLEESVIGSFFVQDFQLKLWGKLFTLRNNPVITNYLKNLLKDKGMRQTVEDTFGDDSEKFVSEFKNDLVQFIFQNALRDFNLGVDPVYKGYSVDSTVPLQYVDKLNFGAFVKKDGDNATIYVDPQQLRAEWVSKSFVANSNSVNSYKSRQLATVPAKAFMWRGADSEKEYYKFVIEREYLRSIMPFAKFEKTKEFKENYTRNFSILQQSKTVEESQEDFAVRVSRATYEQMLRNKALENTFNPWKLFQSDTSVPLQFLQMVQQYPQLEKDYSFVSQLAVVSDQKLEMSNLTLKDRDLTSDKVNRYYENLRKLSDPSVRKVADPEENMRVSMFFAKLPLFAFMQSGLSKNPNSFTQVVPYESFIQVMEGPVKEFVSKVLESENADSVLDTFTSMFVRQNSRLNRKMRTKFKNYLLSTTPVQMRSDFDPEETEQRQVTGDLTPLRKEGIYVYKNTLRKSVSTKEGLVMQNIPKKTADYRTMLKANPDVVFVFSDNENSRSKPSVRTQGPLDMRSMGNALGILTGMKAKESFKDMPAEKISEMKDKIEFDIQQLMEMRNQGKDLAFADTGFGDPKLMPEELFLYLSERLYQEFRFINPGSIDLPTVREIIGQEQGITDQEVADFMRECFNLNT